MKLGTARTTKGYNNLLHIVRLTTYEQTIDKITNSLATLSKFDELRESLNVTSIRLLDLRHKLDTLKPNIRSKRGLINGLGTVIKSITGNMDAEDAHRINREIENLLSDQTNIKNRVNQQTIMNNQMLERFENLTTHINNQQDSIVKYLRHYQEKLSNQIGSNIDILTHAQYLNLINYNIDLLNNHLANLAEAIVLARLNIISKQILSPNEITEIHNIMTNQSVEIRSDEHIYELLGLQAYYNGTNIIFNVQIPILSQEKYSMVHIIPLPINSTKTISVKPYLIHNPKNIQYFNEACPRVEEVYYCKESAHQETTDSSKCIGRLMQNLPAECTLVEGTKTPEITQPEPNYILLTNIPETLINSSCEINNLLIRGTQLVHFENCSVEINGINYFGHTNTYWDDIYIYPMTPNHINYSSTIEDLRLQKLKFYHADNKKAIELLELETRIKDDFTLGILAVTSIIILIILIHITYKRISTKRNRLTNFNKGSAIGNPSLDTDPTGSTPKLQLFWPSLHT